MNKLRQKIKLKLSDFRRKKGSFAPFKDHPLLSSRWELDDDGYVKHPKIINNREKLTNA